MNKLSLICIERFLQRGVLLHSLFNSKFHQLLDIWHRRIDEGMRGSARHNTGHIGHTIMDHTFFNIRGIFVRGWAGCFSATALIDADIK